AAYRELPIASAGLRSYAIIAKPSPPWTSSQCRPSPLVCSMASSSLDMMTTNYPFQRHSPSDKRLGLAAIARSLPVRRTQYSESEGALHLRVQLRRKDRIAVVNEELIGMIARNGVPQLLERPFRRRMSRHIALQNTAASDFQGHEHKQNPETSGHR